MSLHDKIALKAKEDGKKSHQFRTAAQKKANATWVYLIISGVVWYLSNWAWSLIPFLFAVFNAIQCISATIVAEKLEKYEFPVLVDKGKR